MHASPCTRLQSSVKSYLYKVSCAELYCSNTESRTRLPRPGSTAPGSVSDSPPAPVSVDLPPGLLLWALMQVSETPGRARSGPLLGTRSRGLYSFLPRFLQPSRTSLLFSTLPLITIIVIIDLKNYCC